MKVILLERIAKLGDIGSIVNVKAGFGRNFLLPQGKAMPATDANIEVVEQRRAELEAAQADVFGKAQAKATQLEEKQVVIAANAGDEGKLFGSIGSRDIAEAITAQTEIEVAKSEILLPDGALRNTGEYEINVQLHADVVVSVTVTVVPEE